MSFGKEKRKGSKNTTSEQYEMYLHYMQNDYIFRSGTINPTVEENYIEKKWEELCSKLNAVGEGPVLSVDEWKKRVNDWKYATRSKYRKLESYRNRTGSGPQSDMKITDLENKALGVWGKVVVVGTPHVTDYDGIEPSFVNSQTQIDPLQENEFHQIEEIPYIVNLDLPANSMKALPLENINMSINNTSDASKDKLEENVDKISTSEQSSNNSKNRTLMEKRRVYKSNVKKTRPKPLSEIAQNLINRNAENNETLNEFNKTFKTFLGNYVEFETAKLDLERDKLKFQIKKYEHENKDFQYE